MNNKINKQKRNTHIFLSALMSLLIIFIFLFTSIQIVCFNDKHYETQYTKLGIPYYTGMSFDELMDSTNVLLEYIKGSRDNLNTKATIFGEEREVFNKREKNHMVDVKKLYFDAKRLMIISFIVVVSFIMFGAIRYRAKFLCYFSWGYIFGLIFSLIFFSIIGVYAIVDFYTFWTSFHKIFFTNELWYLNPATDILIRMVPEEFFFATVIKILLYFGVFMIASLIMAISNIKKNKIVE